MRDRVAEEQDGLYRRTVAGATEHERVVGQVQLLLRLVDHADDEVDVIAFLESCDVLRAERQKNLGTGRYRVACGFQICDLDPPVTGLFYPGRTGKPIEGNAGDIGSFDGIRRDGLRERVSGINQG